MGRYSPSTIVQKPTNQSEGEDRIHNFWSTFGVTTKYLPNIFEKKTKIKGVECGVRSSHKSLAAGNEVIYCIWKLRAGSTAVRGYLFPHPLHLRGWGRPPHGSRQTAVELTRRVDSELSNRAFERTMGDERTAERARCRRRRCVECLNLELLVFG